MITAYCRCCKTDQPFSVRHNGGSSFDMCCDECHYVITTFPHGDPFAERSAAAMPSGGQSGEAGAVASSGTSEGQARVTPGNGDQRPAVRCGSDENRPMALRGAGNCRVIDEHASPASPSASPAPSTGGGASPASPAGPQFTNEWLRNKIASDPDMETDAGVSGRIGKTMKPVEYLSAPLLSLSSAPSRTNWKVKRLDDK